MATEDSQRSQVEPSPLLNIQDNTLLHYLGIAKGKAKVMPKECYLNAENLTEVQRTEFP